MKLARTLAALAVTALLMSTSASYAAASSNAEAADQHVPVCPAPAPAGAARCHAQVATGAGKFATLSPTGLSPLDIRTAYSWDLGSIGTGAGQTIAIVDAFDDPNALNDLDIFSRTFSLPRPCSATVTTRCFTFTKVNLGGTSNTSWALEIALDIEWAHAVAPGANILLVEAASNTFDDLLAAVDYAKARAGYVSMSWGSREFLGETTFDPHFSAGHSYFASSGDSGTVSYPSSSPSVISVGGTTLTFTDSTKTTLKSETGWSGSGGGCSKYESKNPAQSTDSVTCVGGTRATPDVSLDADPNSGVSVYNSVGCTLPNCWFKVGGTSASSPMWAARAAVAGASVDASYVYGANIAFRDITVGGRSCKTLVGYDLCTGRGSWTH